MVYILSFLKTYFVFICSAFGIARREAAMVCNRGEEFPCATRCILPCLHFLRHALAFFHTHFPSPRVIPPSPYWLSLLFAHTFQKVGLLFESFPNTLQIRETLLDMGHAHNKNVEQK